MHKAAASPCMAAGIIGVCPRGMFALVMRFVLNGALFLRAELMDKQVGH